MAIVGHGGTDIIRQVVTNVVNVFKKKRAICTAPCDGLILKMHYQWSFWLFLAGFSSVWYSWYHRDVITCVSHFNADTQVRLDYINICLSYPYVDLGGNEKRFLLFYRWIHWTLLLLAFCFYIPRKFSKRSENPKLKKLIEDLATHSHRYDQMEHELVERAAKFFAFNLNTHNGIYYKFVTCNIISLAVDIFALNFLDFVFQGRFLFYGWMSFPFLRDPTNFTDYMSTTFPPFANCKITKEYQLTAQRDEEFGCHLTVMELYEKVFVFVWIWLIMLITINCGYLVFLGFLNFPWFKTRILRIEKPRDAEVAVSGLLHQLLDICKIGDVYLLYRLKQHLSHLRFYDLLKKLNDKGLMERMSKDPADRLVQEKNMDNRTRKPTIGMGGPKSKYNNPNDLFIQNSRLLVE